MSIYNPSNLDEVNKMCEWGLTPKEISSVENEFVLSKQNIKDLVEWPIRPDTMLSRLARKDDEGSIQKLTIEALIRALERRNFERIIIQVA